jgi:(+)-abscisic acid 8'-hydroxylase
VLPLFRNIHHNPDHFPCPEKFDPSRFEVSNTSSSILSLSIPLMIESQWLILVCDCVCLQVAPKPNTFMPFGNGTHSCPGNELAKLEMLVFCHHLATKYSWSTSKSESGVQFGPFALPINGLPMTFNSKNDSA